MAKILHTGDIHLGIKLPGLGKSGDKVRASLKDAFIRMIDVCLEMDVAALVIAGDLFDSNRVSKPLIDFAMREIARLKNRPAIILPGASECQDENPIWATITKQECPDNLHLFGYPEQAKFHFPDLGLTFYGRPNSSIKPGESPLAGLVPDQTPGYHIAVAHGSLALPGKAAVDNWPITLDEIENSGFSYVALGHWHSFLRAPTLKVPAAYCGTPETLSFVQRDSGWCTLVNFQEGKTEVEKYRLGRLEWNTIELPCTSFKYTLELEREISKYVGEDKLLRALLIGVFPPEGYIDFDRLRSTLADQFLYLDIIDRSDSAAEELRQVRLPETTILGQFISIMSEQINSEKDEERKRLLRDSLKTGYALLSGKDAI